MGWSIMNITALFDGKPAMYYDLGTLDYIVICVVALFIGISFGNYLRIKYVEKHSVKGK